MVGLNGSGKSTLLRLFAGALRPGAGSVSVGGRVGYLRQDLTLARHLRAEEVLGVSGVRAALAAIEHGQVDDETFAAVGDDWDAEERVRATLDRLGLGHVELDRTVGTLSGGEVVLLGLAAQLLRNPDVLLLDEPTNNLDLRGRQVVYETVESWRGVLGVVTHDRQLLELVDRIAELRDGEVRWYGGNLTAYEEALAVEQDAAERTVKTAESDLRRQRRELAEARIKLDRRQRYGQKMWDTKREPKVVMGERKRQAQVAAGKHRNMHLAKVDEAREWLTDAEQAVRDDDQIRVELPQTSVPATREVLRLTDVRLVSGARAALDVRGPGRIALVGANGAGKTTLLRTVAGLAEPREGRVRRMVPLRYLPQRLDVLDDELSVAANVARFAPAASNNEIRARLARFLFRGARADQPAGTLSGGERFRATLAALLLAEPAPQLFLLDEPTNNLDLASVRQLTQALHAYAGALVVASHDLPFLRTIGVTRWLELDGDQLTESAPR
ncbi:MAG: ATP-binding cassette domain-containing protein [Streptosporangiales bacterium]|nr:ATP-binding cassette domain-containing protein [Streptosporangiales bacterium]